MPQHYSFEMQHEVHGEADASSQEWPTDKGVFLMANSIAHGVRSTANQVLAGIDLRGKYILITGCNSGIGLETMNALAANGAHVIGLARSWVRAKDACAKIGPREIPIHCALAALNYVHVA